MKGLSRTLPDLGMSLPSAVGQIGHKMPPKSWLDLWPKQGRLWTKNNKEYSSQTSYTRVELQLTAVAYQQYTLQGMQYEKHDEALCALDKRTPRYLNTYLRKSFSDPRFLHLPIHRKALKSLTWDSCSLWLAVIFYQDICLTTCIS